MSPSSPPCRQLFRSYAMTVPLDNLARGLLAHALPHLWQKQLASQEGAPMGSRRWLLVLG